MKLLALFTFLPLVATLLIACEGKMQKMSNQELAQKNSECVRNNPTSPGRVTACENIRKECEARREKQIYAC